MSFKMNIQTAIQMNHLHFKQLNKIGWMQYRIYLHYSLKQQNTKPFYNPHIYFMASHIDSTPSHCERSVINEPIIDSYCSYSKKFQVNYINQPIQDSTTYYFKVYLDLTLIQKINFYITVDLLYAQRFKTKFTQINTFQALIRKTTNQFTYLPICFDHYGSLSMDASYHSALMQYKFQNVQDQSPLIQKEFVSLSQYVSNATSGYKKDEIIFFYSTYRKSLENELVCLQERFNQFSKLTLKKGKQSAYAKLNENKKILKCIEQIHISSQQHSTESITQKLSALILEDILNIKALIYQNWNQFNELVKLNHSQIIKFLKNKYLQNLKNRLDSNVLSHRIKYHDWTFNKYGKNSESHLEQVEFIRKSSQQTQLLWERIFPIQNCHFFQDQKQSIKIFQDIYQTGNIAMSKSVPDNEEHIIFLVHGFQAHRNDLIQLKLCLEATHKVKAHISCANIGKTNDSIGSMGKRFAYEVTKYVQLLKKPFKVSFIGHSMGGIVIRSALEHLEFLNGKLHSYISICSPHLGYLYGSSNLIKAGLWLMNTFQKCQSMLQLTMQDHQNLKDTFLFKLSKKHQLNSFTKIAFIASSQDEYVQYQSSRVEKNMLALNDHLKNTIEKEIICEMVDNMLCEIEADQISRIDVIFNIQKKNFDSFIGRTGHVKFLCDPQFLKHFAISLDHLFV